MAREVLDPGRSPGLRHTTSAHVVVHEGRPAPELDPPEPDDLSASVVVLGEEYGRHAIVSVHERPTHDDEVARATSASVAEVYGRILKPSSPSRAG
jgi:hypothetical protein